MPTHLDEKTDSSYRTDSDALPTGVHPELIESPPQSFNSEKLKSILAKLAIPSFCALLLVPSLIQVLSTTPIWPWDQSFYGTMSINSWLRLITQPQFYFYDFSKIASTHAPGIALVGQFFVPIGMALKSIDHGLLLSIILEMFVCLMLIVATGKGLNPKHATVPFIGALIVASAPFFVLLSQTYLVEALGLVAASYFFWILATFEKRRADSNLAHLLFASFVCLASKVSCPVFCVVPGVVILSRLLIWHNKELLPKSKTTALAMVASLLALGLVAAWYITNFSALTQFVREVSVGRVSGYHGYQVPYWEKYVGWGILLLLNWTVGRLLLILPVMLAVAALDWLQQAVKAGVNKSALQKHHNIVLITALVQIAVGIAVLAKTGSADPRYGVALLPAYAVVVMTWCSTIDSKRFLAILATILVFQFCLAQRSNPTWTVKGSQGDAFHQLRIKKVHELCELAADANQRGLSVVLGVNVNWLNANTLNYEALKLRCFGLPAGKFEGYTYLVKERRVRRLLQKKQAFVFVGMTPEILKKDGEELPWANIWANKIRTWIRAVGRPADRRSLVGVEVYDVSL